MSGWSSARLRLLGWLALIAVFGTLVIVLLSFSGFNRTRGLALYADWLGLSLLVLGNYLLLRLKGFAEERFTARGLDWPVWLSVALGLLLEAVTLLFEPGALGFWETGLHTVALIGYGVLLVWLGVRLLAAPGAFGALRALGWLVVAAGLLLASLAFAVQALLPLLGAQLALARVFFRGASELRARS